VEEEEKRKKREGGREQGREGKRSWYGIDHRLDQIVERLEDPRRLIKYHIT